MRWRWRAVLAVLAGALPVGSASPRAGPDPSAGLRLLAAQSDAAVLVAHAQELGTQATPLLNWLGLSVPAWAPRQLGVVQGQDGWAALLTPEGLAAAALPGDAPLAVLLRDGAPGALLAVGGLPDAACARLRAAVHGGPLDGDRAWRETGVCLTPVGECGQHACAPLGLRPAGADRKTLALLEGLPGTGLRAVVTGGRLRRSLPEAAHTVRTLALAVDAAGAPWRAVVDVVLTEPAPAARELRVLPPGLDVVAEPDAILEATAAPTPAALKRWSNAGPARRFAGPWGPGVGSLLEHGDVLAVTLGWRGVSADAQAPLFGGLGVVSGAAPALARGLEQGLAADGWTQDAGLWVRQDQVVQVVADARAVRIASGLTAERGWAPRRLPLEVPRDAAGAVLRLRGHGKRLRGVLESFSALHGAATPGLRAALAARELLGPSLARLGEFSAWLVPRDRGRSWRWVVEADVERMR